MARRALTYAKVVLPVLIVILALTVPGAANAASPAYTVRPGDTFLRNTVAAGGEVQCGFFYIVQRGDNLFRIGLRFGVTVNDLVRANHIHNPNLIFVGQRLFIPCHHVPPICTYVVKRGDNLFRIALRFHTTVDFLADINHICNPNLIFVGQVLRVPCDP